MAKSNHKLIARWNEATHEIRARMIEKLYDAMARGDTRATMRLGLIAVVSSPHLR